MRSPHKLSSARFLLTCLSPVFGWAVFAESLPSGIPFETIEGFNLRRYGLASSDLSVLVDPEPVIQIVRYTNDVLLVYEGGGYFNVLTPSGRFFPPCSATNIAFSCKGISFCTESSSKQTIPWDRINTTNQVDKNPYPSPCKTKPKHGCTWFPILCESASETTGPIYFLREDRTLQTTDATQVEYMAQNPIVGDLDWWTFGHHWVYVDFGLDQGFFLNASGRKVPTNYNLYAPSLWEAPSFNADGLAQVCGEQKKPLVVSTKGDIRSNTQNDVLRAIFECPEPVDLKTNANLSTFGLLPGIAMEDGRSPEWLFVDLLAVRNGTGEIVYSSFQHPDRDLLELSKIRCMAFRKIGSGNDCLYAAVFEFTRGQESFFMPQEQIHFNCGHLTALPKSCSLEMANKILGTLNQIKGISFHVPSEEEWDAACGTPIDPWPTGMVRHVRTLDPLANYAYSPRVSSDCFDLFRNEPVIPVGNLEPNEYGLYDMLGNVSELVRIPGAVDETPEGKKREFFKGGSALDSAWTCCKQSLQCYFSYETDSLTGFRVFATLNVGTGN